MTKLLILVLVAGTASASTMTRYSCEGVSLAAQTPDTDAEVIRPWRRLAQMPSDAWWLLHVHVATARGVPALDTASRVRLQHQLLLVANKLESFPQARARVVALIKRVAPTADELAQLGSGAKPAVTAVLGPRELIIDRATQTCGTGNSIHVSAFGGLLAFRPLRVGAMRALVAQLVAIDRDGKPHVTPLVDAIEMRLGNAVSSPACVVEAGDDGVLRVAHYNELSDRPPFVIRQRGGVGCINCHSSENAMHARDIAGDELERVDALRDAQVAELATSVWQRLKQ